MAAVSATMVAGGSTLLQAPSTLTTREGEVTMAVVTSPCDNVVHSLVNTSLYSGPFLPGFQREGEEEAVRAETEGAAPLLTDIDHVTYVCRAGESRGILEFYRTTCGMERFLVTPAEDLERGVEIGDQVRVGRWSC